MIPKKPKKAKKSFNDLMSEMAKAQSFSTKTNPRINTPFIDLWLNGALTLGKQISIIGPPNHGKSTLSYILIGRLLRTCTKCQTMAYDFTDGTKTKYTCRCGKNDFMNVILVDNELRADKPYLELLGVPFHGEVKMFKHENFVMKWGPTDLKKSGKLLIMNSVNAEATYNFICDELKFGNYHAILIDALNSLPNEKRAEEHKTQPGDLAKMHAEGLKNLLNARVQCYVTHGFIPTIIWTNHMTMSFGMSSFQAKAIEAGGFSPQHYADQRVELTYAKVNDEDITKLSKRPEHLIVRTTRFRIPKSTTGMFEGVKGDYQVFYAPFKNSAGEFEPGDNYAHVKMYNIIVKLGLFTKVKKGWEVFGMTFRIQDDLKAWLRNPANQLETKFWLGVIASTDLSLSYLDSKDYLYNPFIDKDRVKKYLKEVYELRELGKQSGKPKTKSQLLRKNQEKEKLRNLQRSRSQICWTTKQGRISEERTARRYGFKLVQGSGCGSVNKGDFLVGSFCIQHKDTKKFVLNRKILLDIIRDANIYMEMRIPALFVVISTTKKEFTVLPVAAVENSIDIDRRGKTIDQDSIGMVFKISHPQYQYWEVCTVTTLLERSDEL